MLNMIACVRVLDPGRARWCFKFDRDQDFLTAHPDIEATMDKRWPVFAAAVEATLQARRERWKHAVASAGTEGAPAAKAPAAGAQAANSAKAGSRQPLSAEETSLLADVERLLAKHGVLRLDALRTVLPALPAEPVAALALLKRAKIRIVGGPAQGAATRFALSAVTENNALRDVIVKLFDGARVVVKKMVSEKAKEAEIKFSNR